MKREQTSTKSTKSPRLKSGATSIYAVVIATLLFSVITVSFIRIIVNEAGRTASDELSQMAYDAALAGVEDAKTAIKTYLSNPTSSTNPFDGEDCDSVRQILYPGTEGGEIKLSETSTDSSTTDQAYTCVKISRTSKDYRSTLSNTTPVRLVPLRVKDNDTAYRVKYIRLSWFTSDNAGGSEPNYNNEDEFPSINASPYGTPPTLSATIIQTAASFTLDELNDSTEEGSGKTDRATVFLVPTDDISGKNEVDQPTLSNSNRHDSADVPKNTPQKIKCDPANSYYCSVDLKLPDPIGSERNKDTFYLLLSLPYANPETDFSVELYDEDGAIIEMDGAQFIVDSTGRANNMYSRVEARLEFSDSAYPFPQFALQSTGGDIMKNFYVTLDCFRTGRQPESGTWGIGSCNDSNVSP